jgi:hypothetical protein
MGVNDGGDDKAKAVRIRKRESAKQQKSTDHQNVGANNSSIHYAHFEEVLERINPFGTYQIFVCICIVFAQVEWGGQWFFLNPLLHLKDSFHYNFKGTFHLSIWLAPLSPIGNAPFWPMVMAQPHKIRRR